MWFNMTLIRQGNLMWPGLFAFHNTSGKTGQDSVLIGHYLLTGAINKQL